MYSKILNSEDIETFFSKNGLEQYLSTNEFVKKINGEYYRIDADRGGDISYLENELKIVSIDENKIIFESDEQYIAKDEELGFEKEDVTEIKTITNKFILVKENGEWKVEEFTLAF